MQKKLLFLAASLLLVGGVVGLVYYLSTRSASPPNGNTPPSTPPSNPPGGGGNAPSSGGSDDISTPTLGKINNANAWGNSTVHYTSSWTDCVALADSDTIGVGYYPSLPNPSGDASCYIYKAANFPPSGQGCLEQVTAFNPDDQVSSSLLTVPSCQ